MELKESYISEIAGHQSPQAEFPSTPLRRLEAILSAFNISTKAVTLLLLDNEPLSPYGQLFKRFNEIFQGSRVEEFVFTTPARYCRETLSVFGLSQENEDGISITDEGIIYGRPAATRFLRFERDHEISLFPILGRTAKVGSFRPTLSTAMVLMELGETRTTQTDITHKTGLPDESVRQALGRLTRWGLAEKQGIFHRTGESKITYSRTSTPLPNKLPRLGKLMEEVAIAAHLLGEAGTPITNSTVYDLLSPSLKNRFTEPRLRSSIRHYLPELEQAGILIRDLFKGGDTLTQVRILPLGQNLRDELLHPIFELVHDTHPRLEVDQDVVKHLKDFAEITGDLYFPFSKSAEMLYPSKLTDTLIKELESNPGQSAGQLARKLGLIDDTVRGCLNRLMTNDSLPIYTTHTNSVCYYHLGTS